MANRTKTFYENDKTIKIVEHAPNLISMTVTVYSNNGELTYARIYDAYNIIFDDVVNLYKKIGADWIITKEIIDYD